MAGVLAGLHDADGRVAIPGFYDDVVALAEWEREVAAAQDALEGAAWQNAWLEGQTMTLEQSIAYILHEKSTQAADMALIEPESADGGPG